ncbi:LytR/AlgR family response regulator transcription factor [Croceivirga sp. JEA036]|uniref:LytR/AlgR family response regulator transcription factor n=1 Tax=Croceivirga sp. JEA036 TaxID=2721162 RepID=UPI0014396E11|nr:LytTR family DNA-binding domain-containing protein [Croceivirga sp. JEA036]NJB35976.1 response regulator transcription factor [Croceivirga sp. JEA036]
MNCIIVEDQPPAQRILKKFIEEEGSLHLIKTFSDSLAAMDFMRSTAVDVLFLDINLPKMSGLEMLKSLTQTPHVILTTAYSEYALEGYNLNVIDYLLKPFSFQRFVQAVNKVPKRQEVIAPVAENLNRNQSENSFFVKTGHELVKVNPEDISYIHTDADYTELYINTNKLLSHETLKYWMQQLPVSYFMQVHKSYLINLKKIERISGNLVYLGEGYKIPIGRAYKEAFLKRIIG